MFCPAGLRAERGGSGGQERRSLQGSFRKSGGVGFSAQRLPDFKQVTPEVAVFDARSRLVYHGRIDNWYADFGRSRPAPTTHDLDVAIRATLSGKPPALGVTDAVGCYISDLR